MNKASHQHQRRRQGMPASVCESTKLRCTTAGVARTASNVARSGAMAPGPAPWRAAQR